MRTLILVLAIFALSASAFAQSQPLSKADVIALVAGDALPENVAHWVQRRGVDFPLDEPTRTLLVRVGAPDLVLDAVRRAPRHPAATSAAPAEVLDYLVRAGDLLRHKAHSHAQKEIDTALRLTPDEPALHFVMGYILRGQDHFMEALREYSELLKLQPGFPEAYTKISYLLYRLGDPQGALKAADESLAAHAQNAEAYKNRGLAFDLQGNQTAAIAEYKNALRIKPEYPAVLYNIGIAYGNQKNYKESAAAYRAAIALEPDNANTHYNLGSTLLDAKEYDSAAAALAEAKRLAPKRVDIRNNLMIALRRSGKPDAAILEGQELVAMAPRFLRGRVELAYALLDSGRFEESLAQYREAARLDPSDAEIYHGMGDLLSRLGRRADADTAYQKAVELDPSDKHFMLLGQNLYDLKEFPRAREAFEQVIALDPASYRAHWFLGSIALEQKEPVRAVGHLREAMRLRPDDPRLLTEYANSLERSGDMTAAREQLRRAALLDPAQEKTFAIEAYRRLNGDDPARLQEMESVYREVIRALEPDLKQRRVLGLRLADLAATFVALQRPAEALPVYQRATEVLEADGTAPAAQMIDVLSSYAALLKQQNRSSAAAEVEQRIARIRQGETGTAAGFEVAYSGAVAPAPDFATAESRWLELIARAEKMPPDPNIQPRALLGAAGFYKNHQRNTQARELAQRTVDFTRKHYGPVSHATLSAIGFLADVCDAMQDFAAAEQLRLQLLAVMESHGAPPQTANYILRTLADSQMQQRKFEQAEANLRRAEAANPTFPDLNVFDSFVRLYRAWGKWPEAEKYCRKRLDEVEKVWGKDHPVLVSNLRALSEVLRMQNKTAEADALDARLAQLARKKK